MTYDLFSVDDHIIEHADGLDRSPPFQIPRDRSPRRLKRTGASTGCGRASSPHRWASTPWPGNHGRTDDGAHPLQRHAPGMLRPYGAARDMELDGIGASLCFPSLAGFGGRVLGGFATRSWPNSA